MTYDGTNGAAITDWARDGDLSARFQDRSAVIPDEVARVLLAGEPGQGFAWTVVPAGATIHQDPTSRELALELPEPEETDAE